MQTRVLQAQGMTPEVLADHVHKWFQDQDFETQYLRTPHNTLIVQGTKADFWRAAIGLSAALTVEIRSGSEDTLEVTLGAGAWGDKWIVAGLGILWFLPLIFAAAWGAWVQSRLDDDVWAYLETLLPTSTVLADSPVTTPSTEPLPTEWFDPAQGEVYSLQFFQRMESWQKAMADGTIDNSEIAEQGMRVQTLLTTLEPTLSDEAHAKCTQVLSELAVLQGMQSHVLFQQPADLPLTNVPPS